jgi:hypothetical protein
MPSSLGVGLQITRSGSESKKQMSNAYLRCQASLLPNIASFDQSVIVAASFHLCPSMTASMSEKSRFAVFAQ